MAQDWDDCSYELDRLQRASRNASYEAEQAASAQRNYENDRDELQNCLNFPEIYDLLDDGCQSQRWEYESSRSEYESALSSLGYELETVASRIRAVERSCGVELN